MAFSQLTVRWNGFTGAPGWVRMKFDGTLDAGTASTAAANFRTFLSTFAANAPSGSSMTFDSAVALYNIDGTQEGEIAMGTVPSPITGSGVAAYTGGGGLVVNWLTAAFHGGRRVRGRTFIVPLVSTAFQNDGTLSTSTQTGAQSAAVAFAASTPQPIVWSIKGPRGGAGSYMQALMTGATVPDRSALLRSRRD